MSPNPDPGRPRADGVNDILTPRRAVAAATLALSAALAMSGCGKTITIGSSAEKSPPATSSAATPAAAQSTSDGQAAPGGNGSLEVVDKPAQDAGRSGDGGTVVGDDIQTAPPKWVQLSAVTSAPLNAPHLININQAALYRFDQDQPDTSTCYGSCAKKWPAVTVVDGGSVYLAGVDAKQVGAIRRDDGQIQLTVGHRPVYRFARDTEPGDLNGQGVDGTWFAVGPTGDKVTVAS